MRYDIFILRTRGYLGCLVYKLTLIDNVTYIECRCIRGVRYYCFHKSVSPSLSPES